MILVCFSMGLPLGLSMVLTAVLSNRLLAATEPKILFELDPTLLNTTIQIIVMAGGADDQVEHAGLSNIVADLMLRGTKKRTREKFQSDVERMGGGLSGSATHDLIFFTGSVIKENTEKFLDLVGDFLLQPVFDPKEMDSLRTEVLNGISHQKNNNTRLTGIAMRKAAFAGTPLERPIIGTLSTVKRLTRDDVLRKYNNHFHRGTVFFAVATPLPESQIKTLLTAIWQKLPDGHRQARKPVLLKFPKTTTLTLIHKAKTEAGAFMLGQPGITIQDPDRFVLYAGNFSFGSEPLVSRLFRIVRGELGYTYSIGSTYGLIGSASNQKGIYAIHSTPSIEFTAKALFKTLALWDDYLKQGLSAAELTLAKESTINSYPFDFDSAGKRLSERIEEHLYGDPILTPDEFTKRIGAIDDGRLKKSLKDHHGGQSFLVTLLGDETVIRRQLEEEQKSVPAAARLQISQVITPEQLIE